MAATKTAKPKKATSRAAGSASKPKAAARKPKAAARKPKTTASKPKAAAKSSKPDSASATNGSGRAAEAREVVEHAAKNTGHAVGDAVRKAKMPLLAGSAALVGAAGGMALGSRHSHRGKGLRGMGMAAIQRRPHVSLTSRDVARAAKEVGAISAQVGHLANELQSARERSNGSTHRSPIEVVLDGLTARRSQD